MPQAKFSLTEDQIRFISRHEDLGFSDRSALVREAIDHLQAKLEQARLAESARLYAEIYAEERDLQKLTEAAIQDWPQ